MLFAENICRYYTNGGKEKKKEKSTVLGGFSFFLLATREISIENNKYFVYAQHRAHVNFGIHTLYVRERGGGFNRGLAR
jgi:hypothetical protein